jgi:hypothetical protein
MQDELTIKEFVLTVQEYLKHFLRKWYWFLLGAVIAGGVFFFECIHGSGNLHCAAYLSDEK